MGEDLTNGPPAPKAAVRASRGPQLQQAPQTGSRFPLIQRVDHRHAHLTGGKQVRLRVVSEHARHSGHAQAVQRQLEDRRVRLADP